MMFKPGDRVKIISCDETGTVKSTSCKGYSTIVVVKLDNIKKFIPKVKGDHPCTPDVAYYHAYSEDLKHLVSPPKEDDDNWESLWDESST